MSGDEDDAGAKGGLRGALGRLRFLLRLRFIVTIVIVVGLVVHLVLVYNAAKQLEVERAHVTSVYPAGIEGSYTVTFTITIKNPTRTEIEVDRLTYRLHLESDFLGEGEKTFFSVEPGSQELDFSVTFALKDLATSTYTLFNEATATLRIAGKATVPAKVFGLWTYTRVTVPYEHTEEISSGAGPGPDPPPHQVVLAPPTYKPTASADLQWTLNTDPDFARYEVHHSTSPDFTPSEATLEGTVDNQASNSYTVGGLSHLTTHYFRVRVYDLAGQHSDSNIASVFIP